MNYSIPRRVTFFLTDSSNVIVPQLRHKCPNYRRLFGERLKMDQVISPPKTSVSSVTDQADRGAYR